MCILVKVHILEFYILSSETQHLFLNYYHVCTTCMFSVRKMHLFRVRIMFALFHMCTCVDKLRKILSSTKTAVKKWLADLIPRLNALDDA